MNRREKKRRQADRLRAEILVEVLGEAALTAILDEGPSFAESTAPTGNAEDSEERAREIADLLAETIDEDDIEGLLGEEAADGLETNANPRGCNQYKKCGTGGKAKEDEEETRRAELFRQMAKRPRGEVAPAQPTASPTPVPPPPASTYPPLKPAPRGSGYSLPSPQEAVRAVKREDVDIYLTAARKVADRGRAHLHHVAGETGWDEGKLAHVASAAYGLGMAPLRAYEGGLGGLSEKEKRWSFEHEGDRLGVVHVE